MGFTEVVRRIGFSNQNKFSNPTRPVMMDVLERRSMLSASPAGTVTTKAIDGSVTTLAAQKVSATGIRVLTNSSLAGAAVSIFALVIAKAGAGIPTGTFTFLSGSTVLGTKAVGADGTAKFSTTLLPVGTSNISILYSGSGKYTTSQSVSVPHVVTTLTSATQTTNKLSFTESTLFGTGVELISHVAPVTGTAIPTGKVAFYDGTTLLGTGKLNSVGRARMTENFFYVGTHSIKAVYLGSTDALRHVSAVHTETVSAPSLTTTSDGLQIGTSVAGTGTGAVTGQYITANYTLYLTDGTKFQSSLDSGQTFSFKLNASPERVIPGFDEGLTGAKVGETRVLVIPSALGYGSTPASEDGGIPPNSTLVYVVSVVGISNTQPAT